MGAACQSCAPPAEGGVYRRILWIVLAINATMFVVEAATGLIARSLSLQADALDFLADSATYGITLLVLGRSLRWRASAALLKGGAMALFGLAVLGNAVYRVFVLGLPMAGLMGSVGALALVANVISAVLLFRHRNGDANRRSVWLCSRNDAIANLGVIAAAGGVYLTGSGWPDLVVGVFIAGLALWGGLQIIRHALAELRHAHGGQSVISSQSSVTGALEH
jgi:cation diffusion facilitator family transporter